MKLGSLLATVGSKETMRGVNGNQQYFEQNSKLQNNTLYISTKGFIQQVSNVSAVLNGFVSESNTQL